MARSAEFLRSLLGVVDWHSSIAKLLQSPSRVVDWYGQIVSPRVVTNIAGPPGLLLPPPEL
ncbi:hypothetical protein BC827DRAFT_1271298 [Russula dissimulans]|nr:hypothetical protein BC827DRAFT_1271298 [Russula dissimulans]